MLFISHRAVNMTTADDRGILDIQPRPFTYQVKNDDTTLCQVAVNTGVHLTDLRRLNPSLDAVSCNNYLCRGTEVQLPPQIFVRNPNVFGCLFSIGGAVEQLLSLESQLDRLAGAYSGSGKPAAKLPSRRVTNKTAQLAAAIHTEVDRQMTALAAEYELDPNADHAPSRQSLLVEYALDHKPVVQTYKQIEEEFQSAGLVSLQPKHHMTLATAPVKEQKDVLGEDRLHTVLDTSAAEGEELTCRHTHKYIAEFSFLKPCSAVKEMESWAMLPCQSLASLVDALECHNQLLPLPKTRNSFMFIGGTFYIDDRHSEGFVDLSEVIRTFDPTGKGRPNGAYGHCPVKSITTLVADVEVRMNEMCVFRHFGGCDHHFFLRNVRRVGQVRPRRFYPHRLMFAPLVPRKCQVCNQLPSTILTYCDLIAPSNPCFFCPPCFRMLHVNQDGVEVDDGYLKVELPPGKHF